MMCRYRWILLILLLASYALRLGLAGRGQGYWPDELMRYGEAKTAALHLLEGNGARFVQEIVAHPDHTLFRLVALPPALLDLAKGDDPLRTVAYFSLFPVFTLWLVWAIARRSGADEGEALLATALAAGACSLFFYARHHFPYDAALSLLMTAWWMAQKEGRGRMLGAGVVAGLGFLTYNGYWLPLGVGLAVVTMGRAGGWRQRIESAVFAGLGLALMLGAIWSLARSQGRDLVAGWRGTSATITQGDFGLGWRVILEWIWATEGLLAVVWLLGLVLAGWRLKQGRDRALVQWMAVAGLIVAGLIALSDLVHKFVVYGRLVKPLVPFLCLIAARGLMGVKGKPLGPMLRMAVLLMVAGGAAWNFSAVLGQEFPRDFRTRAYTVVRRLNETGLVIYQTLNVEHLRGGQLGREPADHEVILKTKHPLQFRPYQFEGFTAAERADFSRHDIAMRLIRLTWDTGLVPAGEPVGQNLPGPLQLDLRFPIHKTGMSEPIITTGVTGRGDFVYVRYTDPAHVQFGFDHWGRGGSVSPPIPVDYTKVHRLEISMGSLLPPRVAEQNPDGVEKLRQMVGVRLNGRLVFWEWCDFHPVQPGQISIASNLIGGSTTSEGFTGNIQRAQAWPAASFARDIGFDQVVRGRSGLEWEGACGSWRLHCVLNRDAVVSPEVVVQARSGGAIWLEQDGKGQVRFAWQAPDGVRLWSAWHPTGAAEANELLVSVPGDYPAGGEEWRSGHPEWAVLRKAVVLRWNGRTILYLQAEAATGEADEWVLRRGTAIKLPGLEPVAPAAAWSATRQLSVLVARADGDSVWMNYPGPVRLRLRVQSLPVADKMAAPILVAGQTGGGDFLGLRWESDGRARIIFDHWGAAESLVSQPFTITPGRDHELVVSAGFLLPPPDATLYQTQPEWNELKQRMIVMVDGQCAMNVVAESHPSQPEELTLGYNAIGGSTTSVMFPGELEVMGPAERPLTPP